MQSGILNRFSKVIPNSHFSNGGQGGKKVQKFSSHYVAYYPMSEQKQCVKGKKFKCAKDFFPEILGIFEYQIATSLW